MEFHSILIITLPQREYSWRELLHLLVHGPPAVEDADFATNFEIQLRPVPRQELFDVVNSIKGRSAPGWDLISTQFFKDNILVPINPVLQVISLSSRSGEFPDSFKIAKVISIF